MFFIKYLLDKREKSFTGLISARIILLLRVLQCFFKHFELLNLKPQNSCKTLFQIYVLLFSFESISKSSSNYCLCANFTVYLQNSFSTRVTKVWIIAKVPI